MNDDWRDITLPEDKGAHPSSNLEWWYFYGYLTGTGGNRYAIMGAFFRVGETPWPKGHYLIYSWIRLSGGEFEARSLLDHTLAIQMAGFYLPLHLLLHPDDSETWSQYNRLLMHQLPEPHGWLDSANVGSDPTKVHYGKASLLFDDEDSSYGFRLQIDGPESRLELDFIPLKPPAIIDEEGHLNGLRYYSLTRNDVSGRIHREDGIESLSGEGWFDHQWGRSYALFQGGGWNWFGLQLEDGRELLISQLRTGGSSVLPPIGKLITPDGAVISTSKVTLQPLRYWESNATGMRYPVEWSIRLPDFALELHVIPYLDSQEMPIIGPMRAIWEGACSVTGTDGSRGHGFIELVGYAAVP